MLLTSDYVGMMMICSALGVAKGIRSVYMSIVIPSYIPIDRLASASAIQLFGNGIVMMCFGPVLGSIFYFFFFITFKWIPLEMILTKFDYRTYQRCHRKLCWMYNVFEHVYDCHNFNVLCWNDIHLVQKKNRKLLLTIPTHPIQIVSYFRKLSYINFKTFIVWEIKCYESAKKFFPRSLTFSKRKMHFECIIFEKMRKSHWICYAYNMELSINKVYWKKYIFWFWKNITTARILLKIFNNLRQPTSDVFSFFENLSAHPAVIPWTTQFHWYPNGTQLE